MRLLRSSAAQSGLFSRIYFLLGAAFIYALLLVSPASAEETTPSTDTSTAVSPSPTPEPSPSPETTSTPQTSSDVVLPTLEFAPSSEPSLATEPSLVFESVSEVSEPTSTNTESTPEPTQELAPLMSVPPAITSQSEPTPTVTETITPGGDDSSYRIPLETIIVFNGVEYSDVYATTNSVITFGQADGTYWTYPSTPSISIESRDWWARPNMGDEWFIIRTSEGGFQVDGSYRPFGQNSGETTQIVITAQIQTNGTVSYTYTVNGPLSGGERTGARLQDGSIVTLEEIGITQVDEPVVLEPTPVEPEAPTEPEPQPSPPPAPVFDIQLDLNLGLSLELPTEPAPETPPIEEPNQGEEDGSPDDTPSDTPDDTDNPGEVPPSSDNPSEDTDSSTEPDTEEEEQPTEEEQSPTLPEETDETSESDAVIEFEELEEPEPNSQEQENQSKESSEDTTALDKAVSSLLKAFVDGMAVPVSELIKAGVGFSDLPPDTPVELRTDKDGNPVVITAEVAAALETLQSPTAFLSTALGNPSQALLALASIGADMSEEERQQSQETVVAAVIAAGAAIGAAGTRLGKK